LLKLILLSFLGDAEIYIFDSIGTKKIDGQHSTNYFREILIEIHSYEQPW